jgi:hypothetical protein
MDQTLNGICHNSCGSADLDVYSFKRKTASISDLRGRCGESCATCYCYTRKAVATRHLARTSSSAACFTSHSSLPARCCASWQRLSFSALYVNPSPAPRCGRVHQPHAPGGRRLPPPLSNVCRCPLIVPSDIRGRKSGARQINCVRRPAAGGGTGPTATAGMTSPLPDGLGSG